MNIDDNLNEIFGLPEVPKTEHLPITEILDSTGSVSTTEDDFAATRDSLHNLLAIGQEAIEQALEVAKSTEHPKSYEALSSLIGQVSSVSDKLMKLHQTKKRVDAPVKGSDTSVKNTAVFIGSTNDLAKLVKNLSKGEN